MNGGQAIGKGKRGAAKAARAKAWEAFRAGILGKTEFNILMEVIHLSTLRLQGCYASYRTLGERTGVSRDTAKKAVDRLAAKGFVVRHARYKPGTRHRLSNLTEVPGLTRNFSLEWRGALPSGAAYDALPPPAPEQIVEILEMWLNGLDRYDVDTLRYNMGNFWRNARKAEVVQQFLRWWREKYEQTGRKIHDMAAYVGACIRRFSPINRGFWDAMLDYIKGWIQNQKYLKQMAEEGQAVAQDISQDKAQKAEELRQRIADLEKAIAAIPQGPLAPRMLQFLQRKIARLQAELEAVLND